MLKLRELAEVLKEELAIYREILAVSEKKTDVLIKGDIKQLDEIVKTEERLILSIGRQEDLRYKILLDLEKEAGIDAGSATLSEIIEKLGAGEDYGFSKIQQETIEVLTKLEKVNDHNSILLKKSLNSLNSTIELITSSLESETGVYSDKDKKEKKSKSIVDYKV
ncbi:MAG TPA: flagellar protein FlgN [Thermoanaerobacterales bacterium]|nr:flagellar protein FlgN [Thermoanaerobacterales bacterium]